MSRIISHQQSFNSGINDSYHRWLTNSASDLYQDVVFKTDDFYNRPAPEHWIAFLIGGLLALLTVMYWYACRWRKMARLLRELVQQRQKHCRSLGCRMLLATIADNDDAAFTCLRMSCQSMLFLGGFQINYQWTLIFMLVYYAVISFGDSLRVLLALHGCDSLSDLIIVSRRDSAFLKSVRQLETSPSSADGNSSTIACILTLQGGNVYEDISRSSTVVFMVFVTQVILISFVVVDVFNQFPMKTLDGTTGVPVVGTIGSWLIYCLGIFMQCVYVLGPRTNFGTSEQNPHFWLQLLLSAKSTGAVASWHDEIKDAKVERRLHISDLTIWFRFFMSFVINGVGFHILVHALPIQVAAQSTLLGIVIRAVGLVYLVDVDDTPGTKLEIVEHRPSNSHYSGGRAVAKSLSSALRANKTAIATATDKTGSNGADRPLEFAGALDPVDEEATKTVDDAEESEDLPYAKTAEQLIGAAHRKADALYQKLHQDLDALAKKHGVASI